MNGRSYFISGLSDPASFINVIWPDLPKAFILVVALFAVSLASVVYYLVGRGKSKRFWHLVDACWVCASVVSFGLLAINIGFANFQADYQRITSEAESKHSIVQSEIGRFRRIHCYNFVSYAGERVPVPNSTQRYYCDEIIEKRDGESRVSAKINVRGAGEEFPVQEGRLALVYANAETGDGGINEDWNRVIEAIYEYDDAAIMHNNYVTVYWLVALRQNLWMSWLLIFPAIAALRLGRSINEFIEDRRKTL